MNFAAWAGVGARAVAKVKLGDQAEVTAGAGARADEGNNEKSTRQPINE
jgi:hypothetical protein